MERLELKHLAPYLPYGLNIQYLGTETVELVGFNRNTIYHTTGFFVELPCNLRPILRPLSDLTKEIEHNGERFVPKKVLSTWDLEGITFIDMPHIPVNLYELLLKWHFDVFGLIEKGLAVDINTIHSPIK